MLENIHPTNTSGGGGGGDKMSADVICEGSCEKRTRKKGELSKKTEGGTKIKVKD
jgi:hypothetical protein